MGDPFSSSSNLSPFIGTHQAFTHIELLTFSLLFLKKLKNEVVLGFFDFCMLFVELSLRV